MDLWIPWLDPSEKHPTLIQMFIEVLCQHGGVVVDVITSIGGFVILSSTFMFE